MFKIKIWLNFSIVTQYPCSYTARAITIMIMMEGRGSNEIKQYSREYRPHSRG